MCCTGDSGYGGEDGRAAVRGGYGSRGRGRGGAYGLVSDT